MGNYEQVSSFSERERLAVEYAERFAVSHTDIDRAFIERLRQHFSDAEIVELSVLTGFCLGVGRIYTVLDIANECPVVH